MDSDCATSFHARDEAGHPPLTLEGEELLLRVENVTCTFGAEDPIGPGTLTVSTRRLLWLPPPTPSPANQNENQNQIQIQIQNHDATHTCWGFEIPFRAVELHAVARDAEPGPYLYCQVGKGKGRSRGRGRGSQEPTNRQTLIHEHSNPYGQTNEPSPRRRRNATKDGEHQVHQDNRHLGRPRVPTPSTFSLSPSPSPSLIFMYTCHLVTCRSPRPTPTTRGSRTPPWPNSACFRRQVMYWTIYFRPLAPPSSSTQI